MNEFDRIEDPTFPPLFRGEAAPDGVDPFAKAISAAITGVEPGLVVYRLEPHHMRAAMVLTPESSLEDAMAMVFAASLGFADALGVLAPPEVGVHFDWPAVIRVNGAKCGFIQAAASDTKPDEEPDWLVLGLDLPIFPIGDTVEPGQEPDNTTLTEEGCGEVVPTHLLESWVRHTLVWINTWSEDGLTPLHADWRSRAYKLGKDITLDLQGEALNGTFVGLDEQGGMLLRIGDKTTLYPLTKMLEMR